jgi:streptogramin lyase
MALTDGRYEAEVQFYVPNRVSGFSFLASIEADSNVVNLPASGACTLTTLAGNGRPGALDGIGKDAQFYSPSGVVAVPPAMRSLYQTDSGAQIRAFVCDFLNNRIRYLDTAGHVGTFAGMAQGYADGMGPAASFYHPAAIALHPDGSLLVADMVNNRIRRVWRNGQVTTVAGTGATGSTDGAGNVAQFDSPQGIAVTSGGAVFVADTLNHTVRRIVLTGANPASASSYTVATVAGLAGSSGVSDGIGSAARFNGPMHLAADTGSRIYMADAGNASVRVLVPYDSSSMEVSTLASALAGPNGVAADGAHNVYVSEYNGYRIKRVDPGGGVVTIVGTGGTGFTDGPGGTLGGPMGMSLDHSGTLIVCDSSNNALRSVQRVIADAQPQGQWKAGSP